MKKIFVIIGLFCVFIGNSWAETKCGVECTKAIDDKNVYCYGNLYLCDDKKFKSFGNFYDCKYSDPLTRMVDGKKVVGDTNKGKVLFGDRQPKNGEILDFYEEGFCDGCDGGYYYDGIASCYDNLEQAWCKWRKFKNKQNVEWQNNKCNCLDSGMQWSTEKHNCVKSGNGGATGGKRTGGGSSGKSDVKCGVTCDSDTQTLTSLYCDGVFYRCSGKEHVWQEETVPLIELCAHTDPGTVSVGNKRKTIETGDLAIYGGKSITNGDWITEDFCFACPSAKKYLIISDLFGGNYVNSDGTWDEEMYQNCTSNEQHAWCIWRKYKEKKNADWKTDHCECTDQGMEWDAKTHDCVKKKGGGKTGSGSGTTGGKKTCEELHPNGSAERLACCRAGKATTWSGTETDGTCSCVNTTKQWQYTAGARTGQCMTKSENESPTNIMGGLVCNTPCDANHVNNHIFCDNKFFVCTLATGATAIAWKEEVGLYSICEYDNPEHLRASNLNKLATFKGRTVYGTRQSLQAGDVITDIDFRDNFCLGCSDGEYYYKYNGTDYCGDKDPAWCFWQSGRFNTVWQDNKCVCLSGGEWNSDRHACIGSDGREIQINNNNNNNTRVSSDTDDVALRAAVAEITRFFKTAEENASVWKNADGKFNTSRLASDATAGVILGTVGGVVSAHVIKKKQLEKGFDALQCTIGKQKVADFGDEFTVGLRH